MAEKEPAPDTTEDDSVGRLAWFLTGAIIGATVAILYAPQSGKDTRHFLAGRAKESKDAVTDTAKDIVESSKEMFDRGRRIVDDAADLFDRARKLVRGEA